MGVASSMPTVHGLPSNPGDSSIPIPSTSIEWGPCPGDFTPPFSCAKFLVPLDYSDKSSIDLLELSLIKLNATKNPSKGSILFNPGGPGGSGVALIVRNGAEISSILGGQYDLIGFDPRGVGETISFSCFTDAPERASVAGGMPGALNSSDTALGTVWAGDEILADYCVENAQDIGELIGTSFVARDMVRIVDALHEDGLLNYWGFSYGTILGATFAAMFPEKVGRLVLDGVANPHDYYTGFMKDGIIDTDATLAGFFSGCVATPEHCALAQHGSTAEDLANQINDLIKTVKFNPIALKTENGPGLINYDMLKGTIFSSLYSPEDWIKLSTGLHNLLSGNASGFWEVYGESGQGDSNEANAGIRCGDAHTLPPNNLDALKPGLAYLEQESKFAADLWGTSLLDCARWQIHAKEQYVGDFHAKTKNPILFVGNSYDPVTPYASAVNASAGFEGSVVLKQNGYGHCSSAQPSLCTVKAIRAYFVNGTLPAHGTVCEPSIPLFSNMTSKEAYTTITYEEENGSATESDGTIRVREVEKTEDGELLAALMGLSKNLRPFMRI